MSPLLMPTAGPANFEACRWISVEVGRWSAAKDPRRTSRWSRPTGPGSIATSWNGSPTASRNSSITLLTTYCPTPHNLMAHEQVIATLHDLLREPPNHSGTSNLETTSPALAITRASCCSPSSSPPRGRSDNTTELLPCRS